MGLLSTMSSERVLQGRSTFPANMIRQAAATSDLGDLEKFPPEILEMIFPEVLRDANPVTTCQDKNGGSVAFKRLKVLVRDDGAVGLHDVRRHLVCKEYAELLLSNKDVLR